MDNYRLSAKKETYNSIVRAQEAETLAILEGKFLKSIALNLLLIWHNTDGVFADITREEAFSAMYIGKDRAHQCKGLRNWHKQR